MGEWNLHKKLNGMSKYLLILFLVAAMSCTSQKQESIYNGGIFVADTVIKDREQEFNHVFPILALRIDTKKEDTLLIKYKFGREALMDIDAVYNKDCNCFIFLTKLLFAPNGSVRRFASLYVLPDDKIKITFSECDTLKEYFYSLTYIDKVNLKTHRDVYYAEQGFKLFK